MYPTKITTKTAAVVYAMAAILLCLVFEIEGKTTRGCYNELEWNFSN